MTETVTVKDKQGRTIELRKLTALDRIRLFEALGAALSENVAYMGYALTASSVVKINDESRAFPSSKKTLENTIDALGDDGLEAAGEAYKNNYNVGETGDPETIKN